MFYKHTDLIIGIKMKKKSQEKDILVCRLKKFFGDKSLIQSVRKIKHYPVGYSGIWIRAMLRVQVW